jgi:hypothetical protein
VKTDISVECPKLRVMIRSFVLIFIGMATFALRHFVNHPEVKVRRLRTDVDKTQTAKEHSLIFQILK